MSKVRVLIVDDHTLLREAIATLLSTYEEFEVVGEAGGGKEAIERASQLKPDLVLMDIVMPRMNGLEAARRIIKENPSTKVFVLSQYDNKEYISLALKAGAIGYMPKRAAAVELVSAMRTVLQGDYFFHPSIAKTLMEDYRERVEAGEPDPYDRLTDMEKQVLQLMAEDLTDRQIADRLGISVKTVLSHRGNMMEKLDLCNRTEVIKYGIRKGLIT